MGASGLRGCQTVLLLGLSQDPGAYLGLAQRVAATGGACFFVDTYGVVGYSAAQGTTRPHCSSPCGGLVSASYPPGYLPLRYLGALRTPLPPSSPLEANYSSQFRQGVRIFDGLEYLKASPDASDNSLRRDAKVWERGL